MIEELAHTFAVQLRAALNQTEWKQMRERNAGEEYSKHVCASHDFIDANEVMATAFKIATGRDFLPAEGEPSAADTELWNAAWDMAKDRWLTQRWALVERTGERRVFGPFDDVMEATQSVTARALNGEWDVKVMEAAL